MMFTVLTWSFYHHGILNVTREPEVDRVCCELVISWLEGGAEDVIELNQDILKMKRFLEQNRERFSSADSISIEIVDRNSTEGTTGEGKDNKAS